MKTQCPRILSIFFSRVIMFSLFLFFTVSKLNLTVKQNNDKFFTAQQSDFIKKILTDIAGNTFENKQKNTYTVNCKLLAGRLTCAIFSCDLEWCQIIIRKHSLKEINALCFFPSFANPACPSFLLQNNHCRVFSNSK